MKDEQNNGARNNLVYMVAWDWKLVLLLGKGE